MNLETMIVESLRAEEQAQRRFARDHEAKAVLFHRDIHLSIADTLGRLAASIEEAAAASAGQGTAEA